MTRIVHLSDLHFGFHRAELVEPLLDRVNDAGADLVVVTGDVTHRARADQYAEAAAFLGRIQAPLMVLPGNHDAPLYNLPGRFLAPWHGFRRASGRHVDSTLPCHHRGSARNSASDFPDVKRLPGRGKCRS